jgi:hypothetical protein
MVSEPLNSVYNTFISWSLLVFDMEMNHETPTAYLTPEVHQADCHCGSRHESVLFLLAG